MRLWLLYTDHVCRRLLCRLKLAGTISRDFDWGYLKSSKDVSAAVNFFRGTTTYKITPDPKLRTINLTSYCHKFLRIRKGEAWVPEGSSYKPFTPGTFTIKLTGLGSIFSPESKPMFQLVYSPSKTVDLLFPTRFSLLTDSPGTQMI